MKRGRAETSSALPRLQALTAATAATVLVLAITSPALAIPSGAGSAAATSPTGVAYDVNDAGVIVGFVNDAAGKPHAVRWTPDGKVTELKRRPGDDGAKAFGINGRGTIIGQSKGLPVRWNLDGTLTELSYSHDTVYHPFRINDYGHSSGWYEGGPSQPHPVQWAPNGKMSALELLPGGRFSQSWSINAPGVMVGDSERLVDGGAREWHATRWSRDGTPTDLAPSGTDGSTAYDINRHGVVVGPAWTDDGSVWRAVRWNPDGTATDLPGLTGGSMPYPLSINDDGAVAGYSVNAAGKWRAVRWSPSGKITELPALPDSAEDYVWSINRKGVIAGFSIDAAGASRPVKWNPDGSVTRLPGLS